MDPQQLAHVEAMLGGCLSGVKEQRDAGEQAAVQLLKRKECVHLLIGQIQGSQSAGVRQLAAVLLRKKILSHWKRLAPEEKPAIKAQFLQVLGAEPVRLVRLAVAHCIAMLAKAEITAGTWPELFQFLIQCSKSPEAGHREIVILLLHACSHTIAPQLRGNPGPVTEMFLNGLKDPEPSIRLHTLRAVGTFLDETVEEQDELLTKLLPAMFEVMQASFNTEDDEVLMGTFELLEDVIELPSKGRLEFLNQIITYLVQIAGAADCPLKYRERSAELLAWCCQYKPKLLQKRGFVQPICEVAMKFLMDRSCTTVRLELGDDDDGVRPAIAVGTHLLDAAAGGLPSSAVGVPMMEWIKAELIDRKNEDPFVRRAGVLALSALSYGCRDLLREHILFVVDILKMCAADPNPMVRESALLSSCLLADYLQPEILEHHEVLFQLAVQSLTDQSPYLREKAAYLVDTFAENLEEQVEPYAAQLLEKLATVITTPSDLEGLKAREVSVSAMSAIAEALEGKFAPYAEHALSIVIPLLRTNEDLYLTLRARATDSIGIIANAVKGGVFDKYLAEVMELVYQGFQLDYAELNEYAYSFWANMAELYGAQWLPQLPRVMEILFTELATTSVEQKSDHPFADVAKTNIGDDASHEGSDDEDEDSEMGGRGRCLTDSKRLMAQASAFHCMGILAKCAGPEFHPYVTDVAELAINHIRHINQAVRKNAIQALPHLVMVYHKTHPTPRVVGMVSEGALSQDTKDACEYTLEAMLQIIREDEDKDVVAAACDSISELCDSIGAVAVHKSIEPLIEEILDLLQKKAMCQLTEDDDDGDADDDEEDHDQALIDTVFEMIEKLCLAYGESFYPMFTTLLPHIRKYLKPARPDSDHFMATGLIGQCCTALGGAVAPHIQEFAEIAVRGMSSKNGGVRSNCAFTAGALCAAVGPASVPHFPALLQALSSIFSRSEEIPEAFDNAVSSVMKMFRVNHEASHWQQTFPVLLNNIPLKKDMAENANVYSTLQWMVETFPGDMTPYMPKMVGCMVQALTDARVQQPIQMAIVDFLRNLLAQPQWSGLPAQLPADLQGVLQARLAA
eukprot:Sspe_Gene.53549::Locus_29587_Transcript_1_1_Confidence_1.000_Length_3340::g.53549::m.53549/K20221/IPO4, RANBP4; importin-4